MFHNPLERPNSLASRADYPDNSDWRPSQRLNVGNWQDVCFFPDTYDFSDSNTFSDFSMTSQSTASRPVADYGIVDSDLLVYSMEVPPPAEAIPSIARLSPSATADFLPTGHAS